MLVNWKYHKRKLIWGPNDSVVIWAGFWERWKGASSLVVVVVVVGDTLASMVTWLC